MQKRRILQISFLFFLGLFLGSIVYQKQILKQEEINTTLAYFIDGSETYEMPTKESGYYLSGESNLIMELLSLGIMMIGHQN